MNKFYVADNLKGVTAEPVQMNDGGDVDLEAYKRNNSIVEPRKMFYGGVIEKLRKEAAAAEAAAGGPSASEAAGFNPVATMAGGFDDLPIRVQEQLRADLGDVAERASTRASTGMTQEARDALTEKARLDDAAEAAEQLQRQLERSE